MRYLRNFNKVISFSILVAIILACSNSDSISEHEKNEQNSIVAKHGRLSISGSSIIDANGNEIALRGMSLFWSQWAPDYYNYETLEWLRDDWKCTVIRAAMGIEHNGYLNNQSAEYNKITSVIDACIELGIYVIIDWHDHHAEDHLESSKDFFSKIAEAYHDYPNIIYEIYNEPLNVSWNNTLKPYAENIITEIRKHDQDNLIIVGTPNWSQDVDIVVNNEVDDKNVAYSLHFYTGTHRQLLRDKAIKALSAGIPLFVTEWGLSEADAQGDIDIAETNLWTDFIEKYNLSWCNWSVNNKDETTSILLPSTEKLNDWTNDELSEAGKIMRDYLIRKNDPVFQALEEK